MSKDIENLSKHTQSSTLSLNNMFRKIKNLLRRCRLRKPNAIPNGQKQSHEMRMEDSSTTEVTHTNEETKDTCEYDIQAHEMRIEDSSTMEVTHTNEETKDTCQFDMQAHEMRIEDSSTMEVTQTNEETKDTCQFDLQAHEMRIEDSLTTEFTHTNNEKEGTCEFDMQAHEMRIEDSLTTEVTNTNNEKEGTCEFLGKRIQAHEMSITEQKAMLPGAFLNVLFLEDHQSGLQDDLTIVGVSGNPGDSFPSRTIYWPRPLGYGFSLGFIILGGYQFGLGTQGNLAFDEVSGNTVDAFPKELSRPLPLGYHHRGGMRLKIMKKLVKRALRAFALKILFRINTIDD